MTSLTQDHEAGCLMCAVRALTEGAPAVIWTPTEPGQTISGVVLRMGEVDSFLGRFSTPFVDLWTGGTGRVRVGANSSTLQRALDTVAPQIGDTLAVRFDGHRIVQEGRFAGHKIADYTASVQRGH